MNETKVYADAYQTTFADEGTLLDFLGDRAKKSRWLRKPAKSLRLMPIEKDVESMDGYSEEDWKDILNDTEKNTRLAIKFRGESYPVRTCAIKTILDRAGVNGPGLRKLEPSNYAKVVNYCLKVAKGDALIKIADGKVSAVHGGDSSDYSILDMREIFEETMQYLELKFPGSRYVEGSGVYDHAVVTAMWELGGQQELLDTYRTALKDHGISDTIIAPALRLTTSDVAASGANLYPMLLCNNGNRTISLGHPIKLAHKAGAGIGDFYKNLKMLYSRYTDTITDMTKLMDIEIRNPVNCIRLIMRKVGIKKKLINNVADLFEAQYGNAPCTAHDLYFAINEASFFGACEGMQSYALIRLEEDITKVLSLDWSEYDVSGAIKW